MKSVNIVVFFLVALLLLNGCVSSQTPEVEGPGPSLDDSDYQEVVAQLEQVLAKIAELEKTNHSLEEEISELQSELEAHKQGFTEPAVVQEPKPSPTPALTPESFTALIIPGINEIEANPEKGFHWDYYLYVPQNLSPGSNYMLVEPNNTLFSEEYSAHKERALQMVQYRSQVAWSIGVPLLVPVFPRSASVPLYTHSLDRATLLTSRSEYKRLDLQLLSMIDDARDRLLEAGFEINEKILMNGFSASAMFTNRFAILHPERVKAAAIGAPGGWPIAPVPSYEGDILPYPIGAGDLHQVIGKEFNLEAFRDVALFLYLGDQDTNCSIHGTTAGPLGWSQSERDLIAGLFGETPIQRWPIAVELYESAESNAQLRLYPGIGHAITPEMWKDIENFFLASIGNKG